MQKKVIRVICFMMAVLMLFGLISAVIPMAFAASALSVSDAGIEFIKAMEGFNEYPYPDYGHYSVGYGTTCGANDYPNGITEAEAERLLREYLVDEEARLNAFADRYGLQWTQCQYDALLSFTYNLGSNWLNNDSTLRRAVINGATGNDFIFAITRWCTAGEADNKTVQIGLVERRLMEANMYLNGSYAPTVPSNYCYVIFNNNTDSCTNDVRIQGYDSNMADSIRATPSKSGYRFLGWYTAAEGGVWVTSLGTNTSSISTLYAHWQQGAGPLDSEGNVAGTAASYVRIANDNAPVIRATPSISGEELGQLKANEEVTIIADYIDSNNVKWGKLSTGGWINLSSTAAEKGADNAAVGEAIDPVQVTVLRSGVNIRSGPGTQYDKTGTAAKGDLLTITAVYKGGQYEWGKFGTSWICLDYTNYDLVVSESSEEAGIVTATGIVTGTAELNVRSGPGTGYSKVGKLYQGDQVKITLQEAVNGNTWGLTEKGWVSLYYIQVTPVTEGEVPEIEVPEATEPAETPVTPDQTEGSEAPVETPDSSNETENTNAVTGVVVNCGTLNVRSAAGTGNARIGGMVVGTPVTIVAQTTAGGQLWGQLQQGGWVCMSYVELDTVISGDPVGSGTVVNCSTLNIRAGAGTGYAKVGSLTNGTKVEIFETKTVGKATWARIAQGWVHMSYIRQDTGITEDSEPETGETTTGDTSTGNTTAGNTTSSTPTFDNITGNDTTSNTRITGVICKTDTLRIRASAGTKSDVVGTLTKGTEVTILETKRYGSSQWGRIEQGWICMYYVDIDVTTDVEGAKIVTVMAGPLRIRSGPGTDYAHVGNYRYNTKVIVYEETTGKDGRVWGRTDKGWICMEYTK